MSWPILYSNLLYKLGQAFLDIQYFNNHGGVYVFFARRGPEREAREIWRFGPSPSLPKIDQARGRRVVKRLFLNTSPRFRAIVNCN